MGVARYQIRDSRNGDGSVLIVGRNAGGWQVHIPAPNRATAERMVAKLKVGKEPHTPGPDLDWDIAPGGLQASAFPEHRPARPAMPGTQLGLFRRRGGSRTRGASLYADPGYQYDGAPRYPLDTPGRVRNAWARIHQRANAMQYTPHELGLIERAIRAQAARVGIALTEHGRPLHLLAVGVPRRRGHAATPHRHAHGSR